MRAVSEHAIAQDRLLCALTPGHLTRPELDRCLQVLRLTHPIGTTSASAPRFDNRALANASGYRDEILHNVSSVLAKYQGDFITVNPSQQQKIEKDLLWAAFQSYAHLQAVDQEIGLVLDPYSEYANSLKNLTVCRDLLVKNGSDLTVIETLLGHIPVVANVTNGQWYEKAFNDFIDYIDARNNTRLFWVWGRPTLDLVLDVAQQTEARSRLANTTYIPGQISWSLYLFRGTLFFVKFMHKYFSTPKWLREVEGLTAEEQALYRTLYIKAYWDIYKYRILNDYVWGPINLFCLDWWYGTGFFGWLGDFSTCFLLCMDIYLTNLTSIEAQEKFTENQAQYLAKFEELTPKIMLKIHNGIKKSLLVAHPDFDRYSDVEKVSALYVQLSVKSLSKAVLSSDERELLIQLMDWNDVRQAQHNHAERWRRKDQFLAYDRIYTRALLFVFAMCVGFLMTSFLPITVAAMFAKTGTILCMASTIVYRTARAMLQIQQAKEERADLRAQEAHLFEEFLALNIENSKEYHAVIDERMAHVHLSLKKIGAQIDYQSASIQYQYLELARTSLMRFLIPACIGLTLVYAPATLLMVPTYVFVLAASAVLAYILDRWAKAYEPSKNLPEPVMEKDDYQRSKIAPRVYSHYASSSFFSCLRLDRPTESVAAPHAGTYVSC